MILRQTSRFLCCSRTIYTSTVCHTSNWCINKPFGNPIEDLQQYMKVPVLNSKDYIFKPSIAEIEAAQKFFQSSKEQKLEANRGVVDLSLLPKAHLPEVCFIGRSNVGKSSLISSLFYNPKDVQIRVSKKPGHTRSLKFISISKRFCLVDMPGYGYNMPEYFVSTVEEYIRTRSSLERTFLLIDGSVGITSTDEQGISMLEEFGKPYTVVLTKIDKTSHNRILKNFLDLVKTQSKYMMCSFPQPFLVSAHHGAGLPLLRAFIANITGNLSVRS